MDHKKINQCIALCLFSIFLVSCKGKVQPESIQIEKINISDSQVTSRFVTIFEVVINDTSISDLQYHWFLSEDNGYKRDSITSSNKLYWQSPRTIGTYSHRVVVESGSGEELSEEIQFDVDVIAPEKVHGNPSDLGIIAFSARIEGVGNDIYTLNGDGTELKILTSDYDNYDPTWSYDGTQLAYSSSHFGNTDLAIWVMNYDGSNKHLIKGSNGNNSLIGYTPNWGSGRSAITYARCPVCSSGGFNDDIFTYSTLTGEVSYLTDFNFSDIRPKWSPSGNRIAFYSDRDNETLKYDLYIMNSDGSGVERLTFDKQQYGFTWINPDSIILNYYLEDSNMLQLRMINLITNEISDFERSKIPVKATQWLFMDKSNKRIVVFRRYPNEVIYALFYDLVGNFLDSYNLENEELFFANSLEWFFN